MTDTESMARQQFPRSFIDGFSLPRGTNTFDNVTSLATSIASSARAQRITTAPYANEVRRYMPNTVAERLNEAANGYQDSSVNVSELAQGTTIMLKRYPQDAFERTFTEGSTLFISTVDRAHGLTGATVPVLNIMQERRARLNALESQTGLQQQLANISRNAAALRFHRQLSAGTNAIMELMASDPNDFAQKWNPLGAIIKAELDNGSGEPVFSVTVPNIAEKKVRNLFGSPSQGDRCGYIVKEYEMNVNGEWRTLLQVRGWSNHSAPFQLSGENSKALPDDILYKAERTLAATYTETEWDDEKDTFRDVHPNGISAEGWQAVLASVSQIEYEVWTAGKVYMCGLYKGRTQTRGTDVQQMNATINTACYNDLEIITLHNLNGTCHS